MYYKLFGLNQLKSVLKIKTLKNVRLKLRLR